MALSSKENIYQNKDYLAICYSLRSKVLFLEEEEFHSYVLESIWRASEKFDPDKGVKFETYLFHAMRKRLYTQMKTQYRNKTTLYDDMINGIHPEWKEDEWLAKDGCRQEIRDILDSLPKKNRDYLYSKFFLQETDREFCEKAGVTAGELVTLRKKSHRLFKRHYAST